MYTSQYNDGEEFQTLILMQVPKVFRHIHWFIVIVQEQTKKTYGKFILLESQRYFEPLFNLHEAYRISFIGNMRS